MLVSDNIHLVKYSKMINYSITLHGCWRDCNRQGIPPLTGVYFVYKCQNIVGTNSITLGSLLYIGQSGNVQDRVMWHEGRVRWWGALGPGEELAYAFAPVESAYLDDVEAALIYRLRPVFNNELCVRYEKREIILTIHAATAYGLPGLVIAP